MTRLFLATGDALTVVTRRNGAWRAEWSLQGEPAQCVAADPHRPEVVYCGTFGRGLFGSGDGGRSWRPVGDSIPYAEVTAVAPSRAEPGVLWAGTEPSAIFRSEDGGRSWVESPALRDIPSAPTWSFPPRPWTHHVRWIEPDPATAARIFVAIELGGVMKSEDGGRTWQDRKPGAKLDAHTLRVHPLAPGRVYEAAGDGYAESGDGGATWRSLDSGLGWTYLWGLAVDPADPDTVVLSASPGPRHAHDVDWGSGGQREWAGRRAAPPGLHAGPPPWAGYAWHGPEAWLYRRVGDGPWQAVTEGLPGSRGTLAYVLATDASEPHVFYAAPWSDALYRSADGGRTWERLAVVWPEGYRVGRVTALAATAL